MRFDIRELKTVVVCAEHNEKYLTRKQNTINLLKSNGFKNVTSATSPEKYPIGVSMTNIEILKQNLNDEPILVVEDDINITSIPSFIEVPDDTDCVYLGLSLCGTHHISNVGVKGLVNVVNRQNGYSKVYNMLGTHAIVYISKRYKTAIMQMLELLPEVVNDVLISRLQPLFNVLCINRPIFFQDDKTNLENSSATQINFFESSYLKFKI
jgi:hypothetical protein